MSFMGIDGDEIRTIKSDYRELERSIKSGKDAGFPIPKRLRAHVLQHIKSDRKARELKQRLRSKNNHLVDMMDERASGMDNPDGWFPPNREEFTRQLVRMFCLISEDRFGASLDDLADMWRKAWRRSYLTYED
tara:strand:- start:51 stop:449 length:399 start_codon:yes stop_codon:yes gene_type:complete